jgi:hypothetical protein
MLFHQQLTDNPVDVAAHDPLAGRLRLVDPFALTAVLGNGLVMSDVVTDRHPPAAASTDRQALKEGRSLSRRAGPPVGSIGGRVRPETAKVLLVFGPGDVAGMGIEDEGVPFLPGKALARPARLSGPFGSGASVGKSPGIARVLSIR